LAEYLLFLLSAEIFCPMADDRECHFRVELDSYSTAEPERLVFHRIPVREERCPLREIKCLMVPVKDRKRCREPGTRVLPAAMNPAPAQLFFQRVDLFPEGRGDHLGAKADPEDCPFLCDHLPDHLFFSGKKRIVPGIVHAHLSPEKDKPGWQNVRNLTGLIEPFCLKREAPSLKVYPDLTGGLVLPVLEDGDHHPTG